MRIFEHRIFSKFFGGKICHIWTEITYRTGLSKKLAHAYFLAGKLKIFKLPLKIIKLSRLNLRTSVVVLDSGGKFWLLVCRILDKNVVRLYFTFE